MPDLLAIIDDGPGAKQLMSVARSYFTIEIVESATLCDATDLPDGDLYVDVDLGDGALVSSLRRMLTARRSNGRMIFAVPRGVHAAMVQAYALGATDLVPLPIGPAQLAQRLSTALSLLPGNSTDATSAAGAQALVDGAGVLRSIFAAARGVGQIDLAFLGHASQAVADTIADEGFGRWIATVQRHHHGTFQHSLLVAGGAAAFGHHLGMRRSDVERLATAGLLHDIGKARVPLEILDKVTRLTEAEMAVMRSHTVIGHDILSTRSDVPAELLDVVRHHHEYLDGSGYPDGLTAAEIPDLVRVVTITDVFAALIERRSYKRPLPGPVAFEIVHGMSGRLEEALIRAFRPVAMSVSAP